MAECALRRGTKVSIGTPRCQLPASIALRKVSADLTGAIYRLWNQRDLFVKSVTLALKIRKARLKYSKQIQKNGSGPWDASLSLYVESGQGGRWLFLSEVRKRQPWASLLYYR